MFLLTGVPASGKSTVADLLARSFDRGVHVHGDVFRRMVVSGAVSMSPDAGDEAWAQLRLRYRIAGSVADAYFDGGFTVVVQDVVAGPVLAEYVSFIRSRPLIVIVLVPHPDVVAAREAGRVKTGYDDGWTVEEFDAGFRATTPQLGAWVDSSDQTPEETVDEILDRGWREGAVR
ncbi:MAG TPA: AAA family ATPase [Acidimicrobiales bacterium]|nr:AAA family ATPase [Acidimicrobiales bacterium]